MTHPLLSRAHLEALLVARAIVHRDEVAVILRDVEHARLSPAARALLVQLDDSATDFGRQSGDIHCTSASQRQLAERVDAITIADLCFYPLLETILALVNRLPARAPREAAWERDLLRAAS